MFKIEILKERKNIIIIVVIVILLVVYMIYNMLNKETLVTEEEMLVTANSTNETSNTETESEDVIVIHIIGEVQSPGIVKIKDGSRIEDAIEAAGGLTENADITNVNLAYVLDDGIKIRIPSIGDDSQDDYITEDSGTNVIIEDENSSSSSSLVNINKADQTDLETLPGIGPSLASRIIEYRDSNGKFNNIDDIKNVTRHR